MRSLVVARALLTATLLSPLCAAADPPPSLEARRAIADAVAEPVEAVTLAAQDTLALRQLGRLAVDRSKDAHVRQLGTVVANQAAQASDALRQAARQMRIAFPSDVAPDASARIADLEKRAPDESFDRALLDEMLRQERDAAAVLRQAAPDVAEGQQKLLERATVALGEAERSTEIRRKPMGQ